VRGDVDASQSAFCQVVSAGNAEAIVLSEFAQLLLLRRDGKAAAEWAKQAARIEPSSRNLGLLGDALIRAGDLVGAREAWLASAKIAKDDHVAIGKMLNSTLADARASLQHRDAARADRLLRRVLGFDPENATARTEIAVALTRLGFRKSAELWSQHTAAYSQRQ
jgi:Flp pilus assembly protein TadD